MSSLEGTEGNSDSRYFGVSFGNSDMLSDFESLGTSISRRASVVELCDDVRRTPDSVEKNARFRSAVTIVNPCECSWPVMWNWCCGALSRKSERTSMLYYRAVRVASNKTFGVAPALRKCHPIFMVMVSSIVIISALDLQTRLEFLSTKNVN